jgi:spore germination protein GerM
VYYLTPDQSQFMVDKRLIIKAETIPERIHKALDELLNTKKIPSSMIAPIPPGTQLQSVYWNEMDGRVYVSFSKEILDNNPAMHSRMGHNLLHRQHRGGPTATVKEVQILIDAKPFTIPTPIGIGASLLPDHTLCAIRPGPARFEHLPIIVPQGKKKSA